MEFDCLKSNELYDELYELDDGLIEAMNQLYKLMCEKGLDEEPRYKNAASKMIIAMNGYHSVGIKFAIKMDGRNRIINKIAKNPIGRYLVKRAMKD